jgi:hypothetical protein
MKATLYMLSIKEWNFDTMMFKYLWSPFKWIGRQLQFLGAGVVSIVLAIAGIAAIALWIYKPEFLSSVPGIVSVVLLSIALASSLFSFSHRGSALRAWGFLLLAHVFIIAGIGISAAHINTTEIIFYASGILVTFGLGYYCLRKIKAVDHDISLNQYHGYVYEQKITSLLFLLSAIGMLGFPITAAFIGIDVLFTYVGGNQVALITLLALCFVFIELAAIRIFLRIYLGLHKKNYHPLAFRSS